MFAKVFVTYNDFITIDITLSNFLYKVSNGVAFVLNAQFWAHKANDQLDMSGHG